jgi:adenylate cyclase
MRYNARYKGGPSLQRENRRLAAIVAADIAGYSRLIGQDEEGTLRALRSHRAELLDPLIEQHGGRIANTAGDSLLLEFPSAVDAVRCSIAVQEGMSGRNSDVDDDHRIAFRIGINVGDVVAQGDDLLGDGVNVAARLEGLAEPGSIALSDDAYRQVRDRLDVEWLDSGEHEVKNITRPVHVWRWSLSVQRPTEIVSNDGKPLPLPDKPSIAVLPFDNMSGDPEQDYFSDGITEDITTELSRFHGLFVIARNTAATYKGKGIDVAAIASELGVHFVLEGSVRKAGERIRITAQLIDAANGAHVWAERYDSKLENIFDLQEEVTSKVVASAAPHIVHVESSHVERGERRFDEAYDLAWRAFGKLHRGLIARDLQETEDGIEMAHRALAQNTKCDFLYKQLCMTYMLQNLAHWGDDPAGAIDRALDVANDAMTAMPQTDTAYYCLGLARFRKGEFEQARRDLLQAHTLNPNDVQTLIILSWCEATIGDAENTREHAFLSMRLSPKDRFIGASYLSLAMVAFVEHDHKTFLQWGHKAIQAQPNAPIRRAMMIAYAADVGDEALMHTHLDVLNQVAPDFIASVLRGENRLFAKDEHMDMLLDGLRKAGLPEE